MFTRLPLTALLQAGNSRSASTVRGSIPGAEDARAHSDPLSVHIFAQTCAVCGNSCFLVRAELLLDPNHHLQMLARDDLHGVHATLRLATGQQSGAGQRHVHHPLQLLPDHLFRPSCRCSNSLPERLAMHRTHRDSHHIQHLYHHDQLDQTTRTLVSTKVPSPPESEKDAIKSR